MNSYEDPILSAACDDARLIDELTEQRDEWKKLALEMQEALDKSEKSNSLILLENRKLRERIQTLKKLKVIK